MSQTKQDSMNGYQSKYIVNSMVEWLIAKGKSRDSVYFKGETGDRYTMYLFTKRNKDIVDITTLYNSYAMIHQHLLTFLTFQLYVYVQ